MRAEIEETAQALVADGKGILAADESTGTIGKRFAAIDVESTADSRRDYREMLFSAPGLGRYISGVILYDETIRQTSAGGTSLIKVLERQHIMPGIKVDTGAKPLAGCPGETVTEGLDGLRERLIEYHRMGARFAKWRAVITIGDGIPSDTCLSANAHALARYAALCQENGLVPIVEPEVLMDGDHDIDRCFEVTEMTLGLLYEELYFARVALEGTILKPNMVIAGKKCPKQARAAEIAEKTVKCFRRTVPAAVPGIVFLSGGQSDEEATANLNAMNAAFQQQMPWALSFSYGRALQAAPLKAWGGKAENVAAGQRAFAHRAKMNSLAQLGEWSDGLEKAA
jgi:fructose-bisphosphate aldolase class I